MTTESPFSIGTLRPTTKTFELNQRELRGYCYGSILPARSQMNFNAATLELNTIFREQEKVREAYNAAENDPDKRNKITQEWIEIGIRAIDQHIKVLQSIVDKNYNGGLTEEEAEMLATSDPHRNKLMVLLGYRDESEDEEEGATEEGATPKDEEQTPPKRRRQRKNTQEPDGEESPETQPKQD